MIRNTRSEIPYFDKFRPKYQLRNINWVFHPQDDDPFPSIPHGHNIVNRNMKLNPYNGHIYLRGKYWGQVRKKDLLRLHNDKTYQKHKEKALAYQNSIKTQFKMSIDQYKYEKRRKRIYRHLGLPEYSFTLECTQCHRSVR